MDETLRSVRYKFIQLLTNLYPMNKNTQEQNEAVINHLTDMVADHKATIKAMKEEYHLLNCRLSITKRAVTLAENKINF